MKNIYILKPIDPESGPWSPWYDKCFGFIIAADSEQEARKIANDNAGDETITADAMVWMIPEYTSCEILTAPETSGVIMSDVKSV